MSELTKEFDVELLGRLTDAQRQQVYEEERAGIERSAPSISKRAKILIAIYLLGCVLIYFGIPQSLVDLAGTRRWIYQPEGDLIRSLIDAAVELIRPFLAVLCVGWTIAIPIGLIYGVWARGGDILEFIRNIRGRADESD